MTTTNFAAEVREHVLDNGLKVILKQNHNAPVINFNVIYRVGSKYERQGITGISHLLEHMMFKTSKHFPLGEFDRRLKAVGADNNAYTWLDQTVYYETIAADKVEIAMELEAERMQNLSLLPEDHALEMTVVRNELEQREDSPYSLLYEELLANAFSVHNYRIPTIGWVHDVENISTDDIRQYYEAFYQPANAFIVAAGDFDPDELLAQVKRYFGGIPGKEVRLPRLTPEPPQRGEKRFELHRPGQVDFLISGWHIPDSKHPDAFALVVLGNILGRGRTSRLYRAMVDSGKCAMATASSSAFSYTDPFLFVAAAAMNPEVEPAEAEELLHREIETIKTGGVTDSELERAKKQAQVSFVYDRDSLDHEAGSIITFELMGGWRDLDGYLPGIDAVTDDDVRRVAAEYLVRENRTVGTYFAQRMADAPAGDETLDEPPPPHYRPPQIAPAGGSQPGGADDVVVEQLPNGLTVVVQENHNNAAVSINGLVRAGKIDDPEGKPGTGSLAVSMLSSGSPTHTKLELAEIKESAGIELGFAPSRESFSFGGRSLSEDFTLMLDLLAEQLLDPAFPEEELEKTRMQAIASLMHSEDDTFESSFAAARDLMYGEGHPFAGRSDGTQPSIRAATRQDLADWYSANVQPDGAVLTIVGDIETAAAVELVKERFGSWQGARPGRADLLARGGEQRRTDGEVHRRQIAGKSNVSLLWAGPGIPKPREGWAALSIMNFIFGGDFLSRINERLRVKEGMTYGAFSWFSNGLAAGPFCVSVQVNPASVERAVIATTEELQRFCDAGATDEELDQAKRYLSGNFAVKLSTNGAIASVLADAMYLGRGSGFIDDYKSAIENVSLGEVNALAERFADPRNMWQIRAGEVETEEKSAG